MKATHIYISLLILLLSGCTTIIPGGNDGTIIETIHDDKFNDLHDLINRINYNATYREYVRFITQYTKDVDILFKLHTRQILKTERIMF